MSSPEVEAQDLAELSIFPLPQVTLFPGALLPLHVFEPRYREMIGAALASRRVLAIARLMPGFESDYEGRPPVFDVCGVGVIESCSERPDGRFDLTLRGVSRIRITRELPPLRAFRQVQAVLLRDQVPAPALVAAWQAKLAALWSRLAPHLPEPARDLRELTRGVGDAAAYSDRLAAALVVEPEAGQQLLEETDPAERLRLLTARVQELVDALVPGSSARDNALN